MDIEKLATSAVEDAIAKTEFLSSYVNSSDKEPFWDGHIYAFSDSSKKNQYYIGRAPVQVKGKLQEQLSEKNLVILLEQWICAVIVRKVAQFILWYRLMETVLGKKYITKYYCQM